MRARGGSIAAAAAAAALVAIAACSNFTQEPDGPSDGGSDDATTTGDASSVVDGPAGDAADEDTPLPLIAGCSDGTREGYVGAPHLAACDGFWTVEGLTSTTPPTCNRASGNTGAVPSGSGCSAADLCATGWHVCKDHVDVALSMQSAMTTTGPCELTMGADLLYATAQASTGMTRCIDDPMDGGATNDVFGCGRFAEKPDNGCTPLNVRIGIDHFPAGWLFGGAETERATVVHASGPGGVLCCSDPD